MGNIKQINVKNRTYHFFNDMINIKDFNPSLIKIDKKSYKNIGIYHIGYITIKSISDCKNINSANPLYLMIGEVDGYIEKESTGNKYLAFASTDKNKKVLTKIQTFGMKSNIISKQQIQTNLANMKKIS